MLDIQYNCELSFKGNTYWKKQIEIELLMIYDANYTELNRN